MPNRPKAVSRPPRPSCSLMPFFRISSLAFSLSPPAATSACLQSIIGRPVSSRSSRTNAAVISAMSHLHELAVVCCPDRAKSRWVNRRLAVLRERFAPGYWPQKPSLDVAFFRFPGGGDGGHFGLGRLVTFL